MAKQRLTDRIITNSVGLTDLIHIVKTGDTSQNPAGSSYATTINTLVSSMSASTVTGLTFNNFTYDLTLSLDNGNTFTDNLGILASDIKVTGGTYNPSLGEITFVNNSGGTFIVSGITSDYLSLSGGTVTGNTTFTQGLTANTISASTLFINGVQITGDTYVTGGTYSNGTLDFIYNTGGGFQINGIYTGETSYVNTINVGSGLSANTTNGDVIIINTNPDQIVTITGGTSIQIEGSYPNFGVNFTGSTLNDYLSLSGGTVTGNTTFTQGLTANTISASTYFNLPGSTSANCFTDLYVSNLYGCSPIIIHDNLVIESGVTITSTNGGGQIELDYALQPSNILISTDNGGVTEAFINLQPTDLNLSSLNGDVRIQSLNSNNFRSGNLFSNRSQILMEPDFVKIGVVDPSAVFSNDYESVVVYNTLSSDQATSNGNKWPVTVSSKNSTILSGVRNSVILGGSDITASTNNTVYVDNLNINTVGSGAPILNLGIDSNGNVVTGTTGGSGLFTGGTVNGATNFTNGLTANTLFVNGVQITGDTYVTGGTYSAGTILFTNNQNDQFNVSGLTEPFTGGSGNCITDLYITNLHGCSPITVHDEVQSVGSTSTGVMSFSFGDGVTATGDYSHAEGGITLSSGFGSHAEGFQTSATTDFSHAEGDNTLASGYGSHAEGNQTSATSTYSHAEGVGTLASGQGSHAEGDTTTALGDSSHAEGSGTTASGLSSHAEGFLTIASGEGSHSEGFSTTSSGLASHAEGYYNIASGIASHAEGGAFFGKLGLQPFPTSATSYSSHAEGIGTISSGIGSHAEGFLSIASGVASHAEGYLTQSLAENSHAEGINTLSSGNGSHSEGQNTISSGIGSHAEGFSTSATTTYAHAEGGNTLASGLYSHAEGESTTSSGVSSHAEGFGTDASGQSSHAEGSGTTASGNYSHAEGGDTISSGLSSHAEGSGTIASGSYSHAEGISTSATTFGSHAEGYLTLASGLLSKSSGFGTKALHTADNAEGWLTIADSSGSGDPESAAHAEGVATQALSVGAHAEGGGTIASGRGCHAEGAFTVAGPSQYTHAEGFQTSATTDFSHTEGAQTLTTNIGATSGLYAHAEGWGTTAYESYQHVSGRWNNTTNANQYFIIGRGTSNAARANALRVSSNGNLNIAGTLTQSSADYAEYFESLSGDSLPVGTVVELVGKKIKVCVDANNAIGVISSNPSIVGNAEDGTADEWVGKYEKDEWGKHIMVDTEIKLPVGVDKEGNVIYETVIELQPKMSPNYDTNLIYVPRSERPEWNVVGLLGQIRILKNQQIPSRWIKMEDINDEIALYLVR
jgi:hypothetical protein